jgi:hypothetical protein
MDEVSSDGVGDNRLYEDFSGADWKEVQDEASQSSANIGEFDLEIREFAPGELASYPLAQIPI